MDTSIISRRTVTLTGSHAVVLFDLERRSVEHYSRGDHGVGGGRYSREHWTGFVCVFNASDNSIKAVCLCSASREDNLNNTSIEKLIFSSEVNEDKNKEYADLLANEIVSIYENWSKKTIPEWGLQPLPRRKLIQAGIIVDENDQLHMPLVGASAEVKQD
jgi:hypothetical protein